MAKNERIAKEDASCDTGSWPEKINFLCESMDTIAQPFAACYPDGRFLTCNHAFCELTGYSKEEILKKLKWAGELTPPEWQGLMASVFDEMRSSGKQRRYEKEYTRKDGTRVPVEVLVHPVLDEKGNTSYFYAEVTDITERKKAEYLRARNEFILGNLRDILLVINLDGDILEVNESAVKSYGYSKDELLTMNIKDLHSPHEEARATRQFLERCYLYGCTFETEHQRKDGSTFPIEINSRGITIDGRKMLAGIGRDITERKYAEKEMKYLATYPVLNPNPVIETDIAGSISYLNPVAARLFPDMAAMGLRHPFLEGLEGIIEQLKEEGATSLSREVKVGCECYQETIIKLPEKDMIRIYAMDITARKCAEKSARWYATIVESTSDVVTIQDFDGNIRAWNHGAETTYGYSRAEIIGKSIYKIVPERHIMEKKAIVEQLIQGSNNISIETKRIAKDGRILDVWLTLSILKNARGEPSCFATIERDITERKQAEEALRRKEEKCRIVADNTFEWEFWLSPSRQFNYTSPSCKRITGYAPEEFIQDPALFFRIIHPEDQARFEEHITNEANLASHGDIEYRITTRDGNIRWIHHVCDPVFDDSGQFIGSRGSNRDITERKVTENALHESEEKYRDLVENVNDIVWQIDEKFVFTYISPQIFNAWGYTPEEVVGKTPMDFMPPDEAERLSKALKEGVGKREKLLMYEKRHLRKDGRIMYLEVSGQPIIDGNGVYRGYRGVARDITERKRAEEEREKVLHRLSERVKELKALHSVARIFQKQSTIPVLLQEMVSILPPAWQYPDVTTARVTYDGNEYRTNNFIEGRWSQIAEFVTLNRKKGAIEIFYIEEKPPQAEGPFLTEERNLINSMAEMLRSYLDRKQAEEALRESESRFRQLSESLPQLVWTCRADGMCDYVSPQWVDYTGVPEKLQLGCGWLEQVHPDDRERVAREWASTAVRGARYDIEYRLRRYDGVYRWFKARGTPIYDMAGNLVKWFGSNTDIDDLKQAEEALQDAKHQTELYVDLMGHDINNMNHSAMGYLELALQALESEKRLRLDDKVLIERPMQSLANSSALINNVRKLQRLMTEGVKTKPTDLRQIFRELEAISFYSPQDKYVTINIQHAPGYLVEANELLKDVFVNLITNAVKHSDGEKPLTISVKVEPVFENGRKYYRCMVEDNGPGIPDELKGRLFHRFQRGTTRGHGKGLGLYLVRTLVEGYHGRVWVEDRVPGDRTKGAKFVVMLPAAK